MSKDRQRSSSLHPWDFSQGDQCVVRRLSTEKLLSAMQPFSGEEQRRFVLRSKDGDVAFMSNSCALLSADGYPVDPEASIIRRCREAERRVMQVEQQRTVGIVKAGGISDSTSSGPKVELTMQESPLSPDEAHAAAPYGSACDADTGNSTAGGGAGIDAPPLNSSIVVSSFSTASRPTVNFSKPFGADDLSELDISLSEELPLRNGTECLSAAAKLSDGGRAAADWSVGRKVDFDGDGKPVMEGAPRSFSFNGEYQRLTVEEHQRVTRRLSFRKSVMNARGPRIDVPTALGEGRALEGEDVATRGWNGEVDLTVPPIQAAIEAQFSAACSHLAWERRIDAAMPRLAVGMHLLWGSSRLKVIRYFAEADLFLARCEPRDGAPCATPYAVLYRSGHQWQGGAPWSDGGNGDLAPGAFAEAYRAAWGVRLLSWELSREASADGGDSTNLSVDATLFRDGTLTVLRSPIPFVPASRLALTHETLPTAMKLHLRMLCSLLSNRLCHGALNLNTLLIGATADDVVLVPIRWEYLVDFSMFANPLIGRTVRCLARASGRMAIDVRGRRVVSIGTDVEELLGRVLDAYGLQERLPPTAKEHFVALLHACKSPAASTIELLSHLHGLSVSTPSDLEALRASLTKALTLDG